jgi:hypothetical protein
MAGRRTGRGGLRFGRRAAYVGPIGLAAALLVCTAAACGGGSSAGFPGHLQPALHELAAARTGVLTTSYVFSRGDQSLPPIVYVTRFDDVHKRVETRMDLRGFVRFLNQTGETPVGKSGDWRFDVIADSRGALVLYLSSPLFQEPSFQAKLPARIRGKRWMKLDLLEALAQGAGPTSQLLAYLPGFGSPLGYFKALSNRASREKVERIGGVEAQRYAETIDLHPYVRKLPRFLDKIVASSSPKMDALVWVDRSSSVRRIRLSSKPIQSAGGAVMVGTTDLRGLGRKLHIGLPPRSQVFDAAALGN